MAASAADLATLRADITKTLSDKILEYDSRLSSIETALQGVETTRQIHVQQMTKSESDRFAADARMGIIEQAIQDVQQLATWKQTVDNALGTFVLKCDAHEPGQRIKVLEVAAMEQTCPIR